MKALKRGITFAKEAEKFKMLIWLWTTVRERTSLLETKTHFAQCRLSKKVLFEKGYAKAEGIQMPDNTAA